MLFRLFRQFSPASAGSASRGNQPAKPENSARPSQQILQKLLTADAAEKKRSLLAPPVLRFPLQTSDGHGIRLPTVWVNYFATSPGSLQMIDMLSSQSHVSALSV
jgi:hypothetical protein